MNPADSPPPGDGFLVVLLLYALTGAGSGPTSVALVRAPLARPG